MSSPFTEDSLKKLTVPQLKLLCKEKRLVGYSKLPKDPIIARLLDWQKKQNFSPAGFSLEVSALLGAAEQINSAPSVPVPCLPEPRPQHLPVDDAVRIAAPGTAPASSASRANASRSDVLEDRDNSKRLRRDSDGAPSSHVPKKKARVDAPQATDSSETTPSHSTALQTTSTLMHPAAREPVLSIQVQQKTQMCIYEASQQYNSPSKVRPAKIGPRRFKALVPTNNGGPEQSLGNISSVPGQIMFTASETAQALEKDLIHPGYYLDFPHEEQISLKPISLPPSLAQRKHIPTLSLILSGISLQDLKACALVSRSFRYSAYLSASHQLARRFPGVRLRDVLRRYPQKMINLWPYLRLRDQEVRTRKSSYEASFLFEASKGLFEVDERLWSSPDHEKQASVAVRFLTTKLFFLVSIGGDEYKRAEGVGMVLNAEQVVKNEIWKITYRSLSSVQTFYVLESTCEVIGNAEIASHTPISPSINLRADWSAYVQNRLDSQPQTNEHVGLSEHIQWSNHEEYDGGISKLWLKRIKGEGEAGMAKLAVAQRYRFACVISNSISGPWRTSNEMVQDFNGRPLTYTHQPKVKAQRINLFIPAHHHVESVHFTSSNGQGLHPAIAAVQTPGREYFILRDNGMQVGCEEEGIALVWMEILGCSQNGCLFP